jgi:hypothetical protein
MKVIFIFIFMLSSVVGHCYDFGTVAFKQATYNTQSNQLDILYDLEKGENNYFNYAVELYYSLDNGQTFIGPLRLVRGDVGANIAPGSGKAINWDFSIEAPDFTGNSIMFSIKAKARMRPEFYSKFGGPKNAVYSAILPGLGDMKVRHANKYYYLGISAVALGSLGAGFVFSSKANDTYKQYQLAENSDAADALYNKSKQQFRNSQIFFGAAAAIWVTDIVLVALKGAHNKKLIRQTFPKAPQVKVGVAYNYGATGFHLAYKF